MISQSPVTSPGLLRSDHDFRWYWAGQSLSFVGAQVTATALPLVAALTLGAGPGGVSAVATAAFLPNLVLPLLVGHWLDGRSKRRAMIGADVVRALVLATVPAAYLLDALSLPLLVAVGIVSGVASVFFEVGGFAYVPSLVPTARLGEANRAMQGSSTVAQVGGPGLAGLMVQVFGAPLALVADAVSYVLSVVGVAASRRPEPLVDRDDRGRVRDGLAILLGNRVLRSLTVHAALFNGAAQVFVVNLVIWVVQARDVSPALYGLALSAGGVGAFVGTMIALRLAARLGYGPAFAASVSLSCGMPLLTALLPWHGSPLAYGLAAVQLVSGIGLGSANVLSTTLRQTVIPRHRLARTNGAYRSINFGTIPLGSATAGLVGEALGSHVGVALGTLGMALSALPMLSPAVRALREARDAAPSDAGAVLSPR